MAPALTPAAATSAPPPLELAEVERRLAAAIAASPARTRASTLNLICCAADGADARALAQQLATLARRHPGRMLLVVPADRATDEPPCGEWRARILQAGAAAPWDGVCSEIVQLEAAGMALLSASTAVAPLLLGQVPVFLWWRGEDPIANPRFDDLAAIADRILLDSQGLAFEPQAFLRLAEAQRGLHRRGAVSDLTWTRLAMWRRLVAQAFESSAAAHHLRALTAIELESSRGLPVLNGGSLLLAGWLVSRLGWRPARALGPCELECATPAGGAPRLAFRRGERPDSGFLLGSVGLRSAGLSVTVARAGDQLKLAIQSGEAAVARSTLTYPMATLLDALRFELDHLNSDRMAEPAAQASIEILRCLGVERA